MKIALLSLFAIVTFSGCTKTTVQQVNQVYSALYTVTPDKWVLGQDPGNGPTYYSASLSIPELTQDIDLNGGVAVYLSFDLSTEPNPVYEALPEVFNGVAYGAIHTTGSVSIDLRAADGSDIGDKPSAPVLIKVVLMQASPLDQ